MISWYILLVYQLITKSKKMKKLLILVSGCFIAIQIFGQQERKVAFYLNFQVNNSIYDRIQHNSRGFGPGLEILLNTNSKFKPKLEFNWDIFSVTDVMVSTIDGKELVKKTKVPTIFIGTSYHPLNKLYFTFTLGPSFIRSDVYLGIKPCIGFYFAKKQRFTAKLSLTNIFQRDEASKEPFGYMSLGIGIKLF